MSDTKQQCPQCGHTNRKSAVDGMCGWSGGLNADCDCRHHWHDSPVEGSGEPTSSGSGYGINPDSVGHFDNRDQNGVPFNHNFAPRYPWHPTESDCRPDSPSAAGSGAPTQEEWEAEFKRWDESIGNHLSNHCKTRADAMRQAHFGGFFDGWHRGFYYADHCTAPLREQIDDAKKWAERDGWYLVYADRFTRDGKKYGREGESNHGGNCLAWYEHAVFWRERAESSEAELTAERTRREAAERDRDTYRDALQGASSYIEFYAEREMKSPSNNSEAVRETREMLTKVRAALRGKGE